MFSIYSSIQDLELQSLEDKIDNGGQNQPEKVFAVMITVFLKAGVSSQPSKDIKVVGTYHRARGVLQKIKAAQPDVVILDVQLPDGDGISILQEIKSQLGIPVIMLTIYEEGRERAMKNGAYAYLVKGEELDILYQKIRQIGEI